MTNQSSLSGAVKGVSEETASLVAGQMNAIRINQMASTDMLRQLLIGNETDYEGNEIVAQAMLRQQIFHLANIERNTSYNVHLLDIRNDIRDIKNGSGGNSLRSQGTLFPENTVYLHSNLNLVKV